MEGKFDIALAVHNRNGYYIHSLVALHSILSRASRPLATHILHDATLAAREQNLFRQLVGKYGENLYFHDVSGYLERLPWTEAWEKFSPGCMCRLFIPEILPDAKVLYLDSDIVVNADLTSLINPFLAAGQAHPLWAVQDVYASHPVAVHRLQKLGLNPEKYFNSGVLLFDNKVMRSQMGDFSAIMGTVCQRLGPLEYPDQDLLNVIFSAKGPGWLPGRINYQIQYKNRCSLSPEKLEGHIVHYASVKPWESYFPAAALYWREREKLGHALAAEA